MIYHRLRIVLLSQLALLCVGAAGSESGGKRIDDFTRVIQVFESGHTSLSVSDQLKLLTQSGVNINGRNKSGDTPLIWICRGGRGSAADLKLMIGAGADPRTSNSHGETALTALGVSLPTDSKISDGLAGFDGIIECMKVLVEAGADVDAMDRAGVTTIAWYLRKGAFSCVKYLVSAGAKVPILPEIEYEDDPRTLAHKLTKQEHDAIDSLYAAVLYVYGLKHLKNPGIFIGVSGMSRLYQGSDPLVHRIEGHSLCILIGWNEWKDTTVSGLISSEFPQTINRAYLAGDFIEPKADFGSMIERFLQVSRCTDEDLSKLAESCKIDSLRHAAKNMLTKPSRAGKDGSENSKQLDIQKLLNPM